MTELTESRTTKTNKAYKADKSQERIYQYQQTTARPTDQYGKKDTTQHMNKGVSNNMWKRSCYDYVPEEMKARLQKQYEI
jgi:hypothetical protein